LTYPRTAVPVVLTSISASSLGIPFKLVYLEAANNTSGALSFAAYDDDGLCIIPTQQIQPYALLTYNASWGAPCKGLNWIAGGPGLVGWYKGEFISWKAS
jgi:hypothetical protein